MKKVALVLVLALLLSCITAPSVYAVSRDAYAGFACNKFDETTNPSCTTNNFLGAAGANKIYTYRNVNFGETGAELINIGIAAAPGYGDIVRIFIDDPNGTPIATIPVQAVAWGTVVEHSSMLTPLIKGVHDVYLKTGAQTANFYNIVFDEASGATRKYMEYDPDACSYKDIADSPWKNEIELLKGLGFLEDPEEDNLYYPTMPVTRSKFVGIASKLLGDTAEYGGENKFTDVVNDTPYADEINNLAGMGYINGHGDGTFRPYGFITVKDASAILCRILGYHMYADANGDLLAVARRKSILEGLKPNDILTEETMAKIIKNAIDAPMNQIVGIDTSGYNIYKENTEGILSVTSNIFHGEGMVTMSEITALAVPESDLDDTEIIIGNDKYLLGDSHAEMFIGFDCEFYYKKEKSSDRIIIGIQPMPYVDITDITTKDCDIITISENMLEYYDENGKEKTITIPSGTHIFYNGKAIDDKLSNLISDDFRGKVRYVENKNENALFVEEYTNIVIGTSNKAERSIYDIFEAKKYTFSDDKYISFVSKDGEPVDYKQIKPDTVAMMYMSKNATGKKLVRVEISDEKVTGKVTKKQDDKIYIDNVAYVAAKECTEIFTLNSDVTCALNGYGEIVWVTDGATTSESGYKIAWLINYGKEDGAFSSEWKIRVLDTDNEIRAYTLRENCYVDGYRIDEVSTVFKDDMLNAPVQYKMGNEKVIEIDTVVTNAGGEKDKLAPVVTSGSSLYWLKKSRQFFSNTDKKNLFNLSENAPVLIRYEGETDATKFLWGTADDMKTETVDVKAWSFDFSFGMADIILLDKIGVRETSASAFIIDEFVTELDDEGDSYIKVIGKNSVEEVEYTLKGNYPEVEAQITSLNKGDWIAPLLDSRGDIRAIDLIYLNGGASIHSYSFEGEIKTLEPNIHLTKNISEGARANILYEKYLWGDVIERKGDYVKVKYHGADETEYIHLGTQKAARFIDRPIGGIIETGIAVTDIVPGDQVLFEFISKNMYSAYIIGQ